MCTVTCPKGLNPQGAIQELLKMVKDLEENKVEEEILWCKMNLHFEMIKKLNIFLRLIIELIIGDKWSKRELIKKSENLTVKLSELTSRNWKNN